MAERRAKSRVESGGGRAVAVHGLESYMRISMRPLHIAAFIAPLIAVYEVGSAVYLAAPTHGARQTIKAHRLFDDFFHTFGIAGLFFPAAALLTVLLVWHVFVGDRWKVRLWVLAAMFVESIAWTLPLLVLSALHMRAVQGGFPAAWAPALAAQGTGQWMDLPWQARVTIAIGAGLYEEMLFRLVGVAFLHFVLADIFKLKHGTASAIAVIGAALAFAVYHQYHFASGEINWPWLLFLTAAGLYFGMLYILRGFGIVVATHALYDILVLVLLK